MAALRKRHFFLRKYVATMTLIMSKFSNQYFCVACANKIEEKINHFHILETFKVVTISFLYFD